MIIIGRLAEIGGTNINVFVGHSVCVSAAHEMGAEGVTDVDIMNAGS